MPRSRSVAYGDLDDDPDGSFHSLLVAFSALCLRMVKVDEQTLSEHSDGPQTSPDLISEKYLAQMHHAVFQQTHNHSVVYAGFWRATVDMRQYDVPHTIASMLRRFVSDPSDGLVSLVNISKKQPWQTFEPKIWFASTIALHALEHYNQHEIGGEGDNAFENVPAQAFELFRDVDDKVKTLISKQAPSFSLESCRNVIHKLSSIFQQLAAADEVAAREFVIDLMMPIPEMSVSDLSLLVQYVWRFEITKRCIVEGRMEIRILGVDLMQSWLVDIYNAYIQPRSIHPLHPLPAYFAEWLQKHRIIEYLVSVQSHPLLMQKSNNIVGFLVVSGRYTDAETDAIWKVLTTSQDPRRTHEILSMVQAYLNFSSYQLILHIIKKLHDTPIHLFEGFLLSFCRSAFDSLRRQRNSSSAASQTDIAPYRSCLSIIRRSCADTTMDPRRRTEVQHWASAELGQLLCVRPREEDLKELVDDCVADIADCKQSDTGSIRALHTFMKPNPDAELQMLTSRPDLIDLLTDNIAHFVSLAAATQPPSAQHEGLAVRLTFLMDLITFFPQTITPDLGKRIWDVTIGSVAIDDQIRDFSWTHLIRIVNATQTRNPFIDLCIHDFLPRLSPKHIVFGCLTFARDVARYDSRIPEFEDSSDDQRQPERTSLKLLWQMALDIPENKPQLESNAIQILINQYLEPPEVQKRSRATTDAVHIDLVERCIKHLTVAATKLKHFSDGTSSGEDEPMIIVASEEVIEAQRRSYARSLKILQQFIHGVRLLPMYSPEPQSQPILPQNFHQIKGEPVDLMYQSFSGRGGTEIRTVQVGDLESVEELAARLRILTGFAHLTMISGGQRLDAVKMADQRIKDVGLHRKGLLLVKKATATDSIPDLTPSSGLRRVEHSILSHFPILYDLLTLEESLARQAYAFLSSFPPHRNVTALVCSLESTAEQIFPPTAPFKTLYSAQALRSCLTHHLEHVSDSTTPCPPEHH